MQIRNSTPNQTRSTPSACTTGMKIGSVIIIMLTWSTKMPRKISISIIAAITAHGARPAPVIACDRPLDAPENDRICAKVVAPTMMNRIIAEIATVPFSDGEQDLPAQRAVDQREHDRRERADRGRLGRRAPAGGHRADDDAEDRDQRQHVEQERLEAGEAGVAHERRRSAPGSASCARAR